MKHARARDAAFSLTELLIVVAIIMILGSLLVTIRGQAWTTAQQVVCQHNMEQIGVACQTYKNTTRMELVWGETNGQAATRWYHQLQPYLDGKVLGCPLVVGAGGDATPGSDSELGGWIVDPSQRNNANLPILGRCWTPTGSSGTHDIRYDSNRTQVRYWHSDPTQQAAVSYFNLTFYELMDDYWISHGGLDPVYGAGHVSYGGTSWDETGDNLTEDYLQGYGQLWIDSGIKGGVSSDLDHAFQSNYDAIKRFRLVYGGGVHLAPGDMEMVANISQHSELNMKLINTGQIEFVGFEWRGYHWSSNRHGGAEPGDSPPPPTDPSWSPTSLCWWWHNAYGNSSIRGAKCEPSYSDFVAGCDPVTRGAADRPGYEGLAHFWTGSAGSQGVQTYPVAYNVVAEPGWGSQSQYVHPVMTWAEYHYIGGVGVWDSALGKFRAPTQAEWSNPPGSWSGGGYGDLPAWLTISQRDPATKELLPRPSSPRFDPWAGPWWVMNYSDYGTLPKGHDHTNPWRHNCVGISFLTVLDPPQDQGGRAVMEDSATRYTGNPERYYYADDPDRSMYGDPIDMGGFRSSYGYGSYNQDSKQLIQNTATFLAQGTGTGEREVIQLTREGVCTYGYNVLVGQVPRHADGNPLPGFENVARGPEPLNPAQIIRCLDYVSFDARQHTDDIAEGEDGDGDDPADSIQLRHGGKANVLFMDGHVELLTREEILSTSPERWRPAGN